MNNKILKTLLCFGLCVSLFSACSSDKGSKEEITTATNVSVYKTQKSDIVSTVSYAGSLEASESVSIASKVGANALSVHVSEGDYVNAGDVLLELDKTDLQNAYRQAQASYSSAAAGYNSVTNSSTVQASSQVNQALVAAQTAYDQAKANYDREKSLFDNASNTKLASQGYEDAKANYDRVKQLFDMGGASQVELDSAYSTFLNAEENLKTAQTTQSAALDAAKAALTNAENNLNTARQNIGLTETANKSAVATASASLQSALTALDIASNNLSNATLRSPISGYVSKCSVDRGQLVSPGMEIFVITNPDMVDAHINVTESVISYIEVGGEASVSIPSAKKDGIMGIITEVNPVKDPMTGLYGIKVSIDNTQDELKVGMLCDVELVLSKLDDIIKVPSESLIMSGDDYYVYVADGNKAKKVKVTIGISDEEYTEIISGIKSGDSVIVDGKDYLSEKNNDIRVVIEDEFN